MHPSSMANPGLPIMNHPRRPKSLLPRLAAALPLTVLALALSPLGVFAQENRDAAIGLYLKEKGARVACSKITPLSCGDTEAITRGELYVEYVAYLGVFNADAQLGVAGLECSLRYDDGPRSGVDIDSWNSCAGSEYPSDDWPGRSGSANRIVWTTSSSSTLVCNQEEPAGIGTGVTAIAGYFFLTAYSDDKLQIAPWRGSDSSSIPSSNIADCSRRQHEISPENLGYVIFSDETEVKGKLPCTQSIREKTTWGTVKELYNDDRR
jgi:hypothetical protein